MENRILEETILKIYNGTAILFVGAGFSSDAKNSDGGAVLSAKELSLKLCELLGQDYVEGDELQDLAEQCSSDIVLKEKMHTLLLRNFTQTIPSQTQKDLVNLPWRAVFTTNYDDVVEQACNTKKFQSVTPTFNPKNLDSSMPIYYLHGRALDINKGAADASFVI
ncbi:MAG: hypothetical protein JJ858_11185 [Rhizobiaceae bacterium]|nr:hypothetical protein [Rhizobiaceae bacterium]